MDNFLFLKMKKKIFLKLIYHLHIILDENIIYFLFILRLFTIITDNMQFWYMDNEFYFVIEKGTILVLAYLLIATAVCQLSCKLINNMNMYF